MCGILVYQGKKLGFDQFSWHLAKLDHRGPDESRVQGFSRGFFGFNRLAIMDLSARGMQPFTSAEGQMLMCNGEIYDSDTLRQSNSHYPYVSQSDCEVILPLYARVGLKECARTLDGEFAFVLWDAPQQRLVAARDPLGIRPLFYGFTEEKEICFASEMKALIGVCQEISPFPPGHVYDGEAFVAFKEERKTTALSAFNPSAAIAAGIRTRLEAAVIKRLHSDAPIGFLLSGGLDSSLVCAIAQRNWERPIRTFAIGMRSDAIDLKYAREVAVHIGSEHSEVIISEEDVTTHLESVIHALESWDITTVRASVGMYLLCKYIREHTDVKVLLTGEVSDELFGYKYTDYAPSAEEFQKEAQKRVSELYMYDVLRADRCIAAHGIEARVPFSDNEFVQYVMSVPAKLKLNTTGVGKYLLRQAFVGTGLLPDSILFREKAAFSDAVGHSLVETLKCFAATLYNEADVKAARLRFRHAAPYTAESLLYRELFERHYPGLAGCVADFWLPNQSWANCQVSDPSARVLPNYGASGA